MLYFMKHSENSVNVNLLMIIHYMHIPKKTILLNWEYIQKREKIGLLSWQTVIHNCFYLVLNYKLLNKLGLLMF